MDLHCTALLSITLETLSPHIIISSRCDAFARHAGVSEQLPLKSATPPTIESATLVKGNSPIEGIGGNSLPTQEAQEPLTQLQSPQEMPMVEGSFVQESLAAAVPSNGTSDHQGEAPSSHNPSSAEVQTSRCALLKPGDACMATASSMLHQLRHWKLLF